MSQNMMVTGAQDRQGLQHKKNAGVLAVIGLFFAGPLFGILALWQASKASSFGVKATGWTVLAVIDIICGAIMAVAILG